MTGARARIEPQQIYKTLLASGKNETTVNPGMYGFVRGLIVAQTYIICMLMLLAVLVSYTFADVFIYHMVVLDKQAFPKEVKRLTPLDEPNLTRTAICNLAMHLVTKAGTYTFRNADDRLLEIRRLFTDEAWANFASAHLEKGNLDVFKKNQQILTTIASNQALIVSEGEWDGKQQWVVEVPFISTYMAANESQAKRGMLTVTFTRAPVEKYPEGVAISRWKESTKGG